MSSVFSAYALRMTTIICPSYGQRSLCMAGEWETCSGSVLSHTLYVQILMVSNVVPKKDTQSEGGNQPVPQPPAEIYLIHLYLYFSIANSACA